MLSVYELGILAKVIIPEVQSLPARVNTALWDEQDQSHCLGVSADSGAESTSTRFKLN